MINNQLKELENPVWYSLSQTHSKFAIDYGGVKFYNPDICLFGGFINSNKTRKAINEYSHLTNSLFVVGNKPSFEDKITLNKEVFCEQMVLQDLNKPTYKDEIVLLNESHINELYDLIWLVMPGYYKKRTFDMGDFYGIFKKGKLVAVTGERLQTESFIEISAVATHPDYVRNGFAKQLVAYTSQKIIKKDKTPILHVADYNLSAIKLYQKIGFKSTGKIVWRHFLSK